MEDSLKRVSSEVLICTRCALHKSRTVAVPGEGNPSAEILFIGEGPGAEEDRQGRPFVGKAGQLLNEAISLAGLSRENVFITNVVKCRPPHNRTPLAEERAACRPYLDRQMALISPKIICLLGATAVQELLGETSVGRLRGRTVQRNGQLFYVTIHPAAALYNNSLRETFIDDIKKLVEIWRSLKEGKTTEMSLDKYFT